MQFCSTTMVPWLLLTAAGLMLGLASSYAQFWWFVFVGIGLSIYCFEATKTWQQALWQGWYVGSVKAGLVLSWFFAAYPLDWLGLAPGWYQFGLIALFWIPASLLLGSAVALVGAAMQRLKRYNWRLFALPFIWLGAEVVAAALFSVYTLGPGSSVQANFSFGFSGYTLATHDIFVSLAAWGGVYASTVVAVGVAAMLYGLREKPLLSGALLLVVVASYYLPYPVYEKEAPQAEAITVAVIETEWSRGLVTPESEQQKADALIAAVAAASELQPNYVLLPEDARLTEYLGGVASTQSWLSRLFGTSTVLIDSGRTDVAGAVVQRASVYDTSSNTVYQFDKQYLVPQGEYVPYVYQFLLSALPLPPDTARAVGDTTYRPGVSQSIVEMPAYIPAVMFCFESVPPYFNFSDSSEVPFIAHVVSHGWFAQAPQSLWQQLDRMLRLHAAAYNTPIIQAANYTSVKAWDAAGQPQILEVQAEGEEWSVYELTVY